MALGTRVLYELVGVDRASPAFERAGRSASGLERTIGRVGKAIAVAGGAIAAGAVVIGVESVKAATNFQASMEKIRTQAGASQKDVASLGKQVLALGTHTQQGPQQLADALFHLKSVGLDNARAMTALRTASDLAAVGGANLEDTTNALAGAWRSGIKGAHDFGTEAATLNAIIGAGNMRMADLVDAMGTGFLPTARSFGLSLKSVGAALALMTDEGIPANVAATRLRMSFNLLGAPSDKAAAALKSIGISSTGLASAMRSPGGIVAAISLLKSHLDASGLSATKQAQLLSHAFGGGRSSSAILTLVNNLEVLRRKQAQINDTTSRYGGDVVAQRKTAAAQFALLRSNLDVIGIRIGSALLPPIAKFTHFLATTVVPGAVTAASKIGHVFHDIIPVDTIKKDWNDLLVFLGLRKPPKVPVPVHYLPSAPQLPPGGLLHLPKPQPLQLTQADLIHLPAPVRLPAGGLIHPTAGPMGSPAADLIHQIAPEKTATTLASRLSAAFSKINWSDLIGKAISATVGAADKIGAAVLTLMGKVNWADVGKQAVMAFVPFAIGFVNNLAGALISEAIHHPLDLVTFIISLIPIGRIAGIVGKLLGDVPILGRFVTFFTKPLEAAGGFVERALGRMLRKVFGPVADRIGAFFKDAGTWLYVKGDDLIQGFQRGIMSVARRIGGWLLDHVVKPAVRPFADAGSWLISKGAAIIRGLESGIMSLARSISGWLGAHVVSPALNRFAAAGSWLVARGRQLISGLESGVLSVARSIGSWLGDHVVRPVTSRFSAAGRWLLSAGGNLITGFLGGIRAKMAGIGSWIKGNIIDPVVNWVKHFFGIHSPSTVFHGIGFNMIAGLLRGMTSHDITGFITKIFGSMPKALGYIVEKGLVSLAHLPGRALHALEGLGGSFLGKIGGFFGRLFGGGDSGAHSGSAAAAQAYARAVLGRYGWSQSQMAALIPLWNQESGWNRFARNPSSGAYGIPQALPPGKMGAAANPPTSSAAAQINWGLGYIRGRYGSPAGAWAHERRFNWYGHGGVFRAGQLIGVGDRGPELAVFSQPGRVLSPEESRDSIRPARPASVALTQNGDVYIRDPVDWNIVSGKLSFAVTASGFG